MKEKHFPRNRFTKWMRIGGRLTNYLSVGQIYLCDNSSLKRPLMPTEHVTKAVLTILSRSRH